MRELHPLAAGNTLEEWQEADILRLVIGRVQE